MAREGPGKGRGGQPGRDPCMGRKVLSSGCRGEGCPDKDWGRGPPCEGEQHGSGALGWVCVDRGPLSPQPRDPGSGAEPSPSELGL